MALQVFQQHQKYVAPPSKRWLNDRWCPVTFLRHKDTSSLQGAASIRSSPSILSITSVRAPCCWSPHCLEGETKSGEWHQPPPASHKQTFPLISSYFQHRPCSTARAVKWPGQPHYPRASMLSGHHEMLIPLQLLAECTEIHSRPEKDSVVAALCAAMQTCRCSQILCLQCFTWFSSLAC